MRVVFVSHASNLEGAELSLLELIESTKGAGNQVFVIVNGEGDLTSELKFRDIPFARFNYSWWQTAGDGFSQSWSQKSLFESERIKDSLDEFSPDLIYSNTSVISIGMTLAAKMDIPHISHIRELASGKIYDRFRKALPIIGQTLSSCSNLLVFNSQTTFESWKEFFHRVDHCEVVYNPLASLEIQDLEKQEEQFRIGMVGSILPIKNQLEGLKALAFANDTDLH